MKIDAVRTTDDGKRHLDISANIIPYYRLIRFIRKMPDTIVDNHPKHQAYPNADAIVLWCGSIITIEKVFCDYVIRSHTNTEKFDEFIERLRSYKVRWWEKLSRFNPVTLLMEHLFARQQ